MGTSVIAAQLYTVMNYCKTPADIASTLAKIKKMGYQAVQASALGPHDAKELAKMLEGEGLVCCATHKSLDDMKNTNAILDYHATIKCQYTAIGGWGWGPAHTAAEWSDITQQLSTVAKTLSAKGLFVGYHNHAHEFGRIKDQPKRRPMELILEEADKSVWFELDTYWAAFGGEEPSRWIPKYAGRIPCIHLKDYIYDTTQDPHKVKMCEVGSGNLAWKNILEECQKAGVKWYIVERDSGDLDPFDSLKISLDNLRALGLN